MTSTPPIKGKKSLLKDIPVNTWSSSLFLFFTYLYLIAGNIPRLVSLPGLQNNLLLTEFLLYLLTLFTLFLNMRLLAKLFMAMGTVITLIALSFLSGVLREGFDFAPLSYTLRLILLLMTGYVFGYSLHQAHKEDVVKVLKQFSFLYLALALTGFAIYVTFPDSVQLWNVLSTYGIRFNGDPHQRRLLSSYFDPNYYSAIACIGVIASFLAYYYSRQLRYLITGLMIIVSLLLSSSRSGIATLLAVFLLILFQVGKYLLRHHTFSRRLAVLFPLILLGAVSLSPVYIEPVLRAWQRIVELDASAQVRFDSFALGQELFSIAPVFGLGYNYLVIYAERARGLSSLDSSVQATLINFGILGTSILAFNLSWYFLKCYRALRKHLPSLRTKLHLTLWYLNGYVLISVLFTSQFNNLLYYQFWLIPVVALYAYVWLVAKS
jgi:O-antigen ligase